MVDDEDFEYLNSFRWTAKIHGHLKYAERNYRGKTIKLHRLIMSVTEKNMFIDHIDGNGLNNQKINLRICSSAENTRNHRKISNLLTSKFIGVHLHKKTNKWRAGVRFNKNLIDLGLFKNEEDAAMAYDRKAFEVFGEFANLNFK